MLRRSSCVFYKILLLNSSWHSSFSTTLTLLSPCIEEFGGIGTEIPEPWDRSRWCSQWWIYKCKFNWGYFGYILLKTKITFG